MKTTLHEYIKDNWRTWPTMTDFAMHYGVSPQCVRNWIKRDGGAYVEQGKVISGSKRGTVLLDLSDACGDYIPTISEQRETLCKQSSTATDIK